MSFIDFMPKIRVWDVRVGKARPGLIDNEATAELTLKYNWRRKSIITDIDRHPPSIIHQIDGCADFQCHGDGIPRITFIRHAPISAGRMRQGLLTHLLGSREATCCQGF